MNWVPFGRPLKNHLSKSWTHLLKLDLNSSGIWSYLGRSISISRGAPKVIVASSISTGVGIFIDFLIIVRFITDELNGVEENL